MSTSFSPSRSPGSARLQFGWAPQRLRSSSLKKPPEPLRRAVADCLSSSSSSHHGNPSTIASEASRTLRCGNGRGTSDYLAASSTTDLAYTVILEHTLAERERSPAVVARCVALLKRYLLRYVPSEETLLQIDLFCLNSVAECDSNPNRRVSPWSKTVSENSGATTSINVFTPSLPASGFAPEALVKSLNYVRSLVARRMPTQTFQPAAFSGATTASKHSLPTLSSFLSRSFSSQLSPVTPNCRESPERKEVSSLSVPKLSSVKRVDWREDLNYIPDDVLKWRWPGEQQSPFAATECGNVTSPQDVSMRSFVEVGAAALLVGEMEAKMKGRPWKQLDTGEFPDSDQLLRPSTVTTASNIASSHSHLRAITASKRMKPGTHQIWVDSPVSTFRPRARPLFQYRHYSEQQPLRLNPAEVCEVIAAVCSETISTSANHMTISSRLSNNIGAPSMDHVAGSVLIKLVIDMYVLDSRIAAPLTLSMLEDMLNSPRLTSRTRAFDLILNLGIHAHLLEPISLDDNPTIQECSEEPYFNNEGQIGTQENKVTGFHKQSGVSAAIDKFECWILNILYEILLLLVQIEEKEESVWASALSCLLYFVSDRGKIWRSRLEGLDIRVIKVLLEISREHSWAEVVHCKLICMLTNMFYHVPDGPEKDILNTQIFLVDQVDLVGGIEFLCLEYSRANSREEKRNVFMVLFDYVLHHLNETCLITGASEISIEEIQPLATMLALADAPEAFYISVKHGLEGIGEILRRSISAALSRYPNKERLNMLLEKITGKFDTILGSFTRLEEEFSHMIRMTKSCKYLETIEDAVPGIGAGMEVKLSWATLHSLLHSGRSAYRRNGYIWLVELLLSEVSEHRGTSIWSNIGNLQRQIELTGGQDSSVPSKVPLPVSIMCGLLKSKHNFIRRGFLFVLEKLLMRCKLLLDENEPQHLSTDQLGEKCGDSHLEKANALIDVMSSALSLVENETDRINILKMCDILFYQLCLRVLPASAMPLGDLMSRGKLFGCTDVNGQIGADLNHRGDELLEEIDSRAGCNDIPPLSCNTASMAALLLQGQAIVPMQLVARVPAALLFWPLIQLAGAATDDIALGVAVGSKGRGNLPGAASDIRAGLLLLLIGKCTADPDALQDVEGEEFFRGLLDDMDSRVAYYSSAFLLKRMMTEDPEKYQHTLQSLIFRAQQSNNEKLLENPYLQMRGILQLSNDSGTGL